MSITKRKSTLGPGGKIAPRPGKVIASPPKTAGDPGPAKGMLQSKRRPPVTKYLRKIKRKASSGKITTYPASYAGMWVAWTLDGRRIVASAKSLPALRAVLIRAGGRRAIFERVPRNYEPILADLTG